MNEKQVFDVQGFRQAFPIFQHADNQRLVYLDNAATTQKPQAMIDAIAAYYSGFHANAHRASHRLARQATAMIEKTRAKSAEFLGAASPKNIVFCRGATEALNLVAFSMSQQWQAGDEVILSVAEHHANLVPWQLIAQQRGITLRFLPLTKNERGCSIDVDQLPALLTSRTKLVALSLASNVLGVKLPVESIRHHCRAVGVPLLLDASQWIAHETIDVNQLGCDFLVASTHKCFGPTGLGLLFLNSPWCSELAPWQGGGEMVQQVTLEQTTFVRDVHRFEPGTSSLAAIAGWGAVLDFWQRIDRAALEAYEQSLCRYLHAKVAPFDQLSVLTRAEQNVGILSIASAHEKIQMQDVAVLLDEQDIAVRCGVHCAQPLVNTLGCRELLRVSLAAYNTEQEIDRFVAVLEQIVSLLLEEKTGEQKSQNNALIEADDLSDIDVNALSQVGHWQGRYRLLLQWGDLIKPKPLIRTDENRVEGCESTAWIALSPLADRKLLVMDSESRVIRGLMALIQCLLDKGHVRSADPDLWQAFLTQYGLEKHLSESRANGFRLMLLRAQSLLGL